jgi:hypothetical protein
MKYFEAYLKSTDSADDIDISVQWDVNIFEWLMDYLQGKDPKLEYKNVIPILISADFLVMKRLIDDCTSFIVQNISDVVKIPIDMSCLSQLIVKQIADSMTLEQLDACKDPRDNLQSKLFSHKLDDMLQIEKNKLSRWIYCNILYTEEQTEWMTCPKADIFIDFRGRVLAKHVPDSNWSIDEFFAFLKKNSVSWRRIFWKVWARLIFDECTQWGLKFVLAESDHWTYHPEKPQFLYGCNNGTYPWWEAEAVRFNTNSNHSGCRFQPHLFKNMKSDSLEYIFMAKHDDLLKELPNKPSSDTQRQSGEIKVDLPTEYDAKKIPIKHKLMSLLALLKEFVSTKYLKLRNNSCLEWALLGTWCRYWLMECDEDDDINDFNFVLPRNLKPSSQCKPFLNNIHSIDHMHERLRRQYSYPIKCKYSRQIQVMETRLL